MWSVNMWNEGGLEASLPWDVRLCTKSTTTTNAGFNTNG